MAIALTAIENKLSDAIDVDREHDRALAERILKLETATLERLTMTRATSARQQTWKVALTGAAVSIVVVVANIITALYRDR